MGFDSSLSTYLDRQFHRLPGIFAIASICFFASVLFSGEIKETYDDGKPKLHYRTDAKDQRIGTYEEFFPNGKVKVRGQYTAGKKSGLWTTFEDTGKVTETAAYRSSKRA